MDRRSFHILVVNPGSTSTKVSLFVDLDERVTAAIKHGAGDLAAYPETIDQAGFREAAVRGFLEEHSIEIGGLSAVIGRGGLMRPVESGVFRVNEAMVRDLSSARYGRHASNLGAVIASKIAQEAGCEAFIADPVVVDEMDAVARFSGIPEIERRSIFHALNQKSAAREAAERRGKRYEKLNLIVAHLGGGVSVGAHKEGRVVDVNNALDGDGPFAPERAGGLPAGQLIDLAVSGSVPDIKRRLTGGGGMVAYCGTNDLAELIGRIDSGDLHAAEVFEAMAYQISKEIASHGATLSGRVDFIVLTGGMAQNERIVERIRHRVSYLAPIEVIPGEREMISLARAAFGVLSGAVAPKDY